MVQFVMQNLGSKNYTKNYHFWLYWVNQELLKPICLFTDKTISLQVPYVQQNLRRVLSPNVYDIIEI